MVAHGSVLSAPSAADARILGARAGPVESGAPGRRPARQGKTPRRRGTARRIELEKVLVMKPGRRAARAAPSATPAQRGEAAERADQEEGGCGERDRRSVGCEAEKADNLAIRYRGRKALA
jgi:hypothetical protein